MRDRQTSLPRQWLVADDRLGEQLWEAAAKLPRGSGILVLHRGLSRAKRAKLLARLRRLARLRSVAVIDEAAGQSARVHSMRELRRAGTARVPLLFLSPVNRTASHPDWEPLAPMRAATLAQLARTPVIALGGMDEQRFRRVKRLGFSGWAGIGAYIR